MAQLIYPELSYKLMGVLFKIHSDLGPSYTEKQYQKAIAIQLNSRHINFQKEAPVTLSYENKEFGKFYADFLIEDKIVLEIKTVKFLRPHDVKQVLKYLEALRIKLGILVNFRKDRLEYKRIINNRI
jgi:GxxExxY protein